MAAGETLEANRGHAAIPDHLGKLPYEFALEVVSYLTLGGYDNNDMKNSTNLVWYDTTEGGDSWNITAVNMTIGDMNVNPSGNVTTGP
jgi:hypothetical protein